MNNIYVRPFEPDDWAAIELRQWERENISVDSVFAISSYGQLFTVFIGDTILALFGFWKKWEGVYEVYVYPSTHTNSRPIFYVRWVRRLLDTIAKSHRMRRQETTSLADEQTDRWMRALGFECEGTKRQFTAKREDCRMWVRFNEVES